MYGGLLLVACTLSFALLLRTCTYSAALRIDRGYGAVLAVIALALLAVRGLPGLTSPLVLSMAFAAPLFLSGAWCAVGGILALPLLAAATRGIQASDSILPAR